MLTKKHKNAIIVFTLIEVGMNFDKQVTIAYEL